MSLCQGEGRGCDSHHPLHTVYKGRKKVLMVNVRNLSPIVAILGMVLGITLHCTGCTAQQVQDAKTTLINVLQKADDAVEVLADNQAAVTDTEAALSALAAILPQTGPIHQAMVDAQAALNNLAAHPGNVTAVHNALQKVISLLEGNGSIPLTAVRHKSKAFTPKAE